MAGCLFTCVNKFVTLLLQKLPKALKVSKLFTFLLNLSTLQQVPISNGTNTPCSSTKCEVKLELAFEYLMSKDRLQWVTITSQQVRPSVDIIYLWEHFISTDVFSINKLSWSWKQLCWRAHNKQTKLLVWRVDCFYNESRAENLFVTNSFLGFMNRISLPLWFQAIMMSICLQSMVDELMVKKSGGSIKKVCI